MACQPPAIECESGREADDDDGAFDECDPPARREAMAADFLFLDSRGDLLRLCSFLSEHGREEAVTWLERFADELLLTVRRLQNDNATLEAAIVRERRESQRRLRELEEEAQAFVDAAEPDIRRELSKRYELERQQFEHELANLRNEADYCGGGGVGDDGVRRRAVGAANTGAVASCAIVVHTPAEQQQQQQCQCSSHRAVCELLRQMEQQNRALRSELAHAQAETAAVRGSVASLRAIAAPGPCGQPTDRADSLLMEDFLSQNANLLQEVQLLRQTNVALKDLNDTLEAEMEDLRKGHRRRIIPPPEAAFMDSSSPHDRDRSLILPLSEELSLAGVNFGLPVCDTIPEEYDNDSGAFVNEKDQPEHKHLGHRGDGHVCPDAGAYHPLAVPHRHFSNRSSQDSSDSGVQDSLSTCQWEQGSAKDSGKIYRVILAGDAGVGKTSFIIRLCSGRFSSTTSSTLGVDFQSKSVVLDDKMYTLQLWDTAGQERFRSITRSYFRRADGVLLLFDCTYEQSFLSIRKWIDDIEENTTKRPPMLICANKADLRDAAISKGVRVVDRGDAIKLAQEYGVLFMESSAKDGRNIVDAIVSLTRVIRDADEASRQASSSIPRFYQSPLQKQRTPQVKKCC